MTKATKPYRHGKSNNNIRKRTPFGENLSKMALRALALTLALTPIEMITNANANANANAYKSIFFG